MSEYDPSYSMSTSPNSKAANAFHGFHGQQQQQQPFPQAQSNWQGQQQKQGEDFALQSVFLFISLLNETIQTRCMA